VGIPVQLLNFQEKIELSIDLFTRIFIGFDIDGCANF
jgi:hypothetical protein